MPQLPLRLVPPMRLLQEAPGEGYRRGSGAARASDVASRGEPVPHVPARAAAIDRLRALVGARGHVGILPPPREPVARELRAGMPTVLPGHLSTGIAGLDAWLHGWPQSGPVELVGPPGSGRLALVIPLLERLTRQGRSIVLVDPLHQVHPPGLGRVDPSRLVLVRPPGERAAWAAEQVARSGAVDALLVIDAPAFGRGGVRLARAAEAGGVAVFVLAERPDAELPAALRLETAGWQADRLCVRCTRSRDGRMVGERWIAPAEAPQDVGSSSMTRVEAGRSRRRVGAG